MVSIWCCGKDKDPMDADDELSVWPLKIRLSLIKYT